MVLPGGKQNLSLNENNQELEELAEYAVEQHNNCQNAQLSYVRLISAQEQVVEGMLYYLTLEAESGGQTKLYEAKVFEKVWEHVKSLESFEPIQGSSITMGDLRVKPDGLAANSDSKAGLQPVPHGDPVVKEAVEQALTGLQERSNSLVSYELKDVLSANAEITEDLAEFELVLAVVRGTYEEQCKTVLEHTVNGKWVVKHMQLQK